LGASLAKGHVHFLKLLASTVAQKLKANPKILGSSSSPRPHLPFTIGVIFMMGHGKDKLCTKFEAGSFSHCVNIKGEPQIFGSFPNPRLCPFFSSVWHFMMGFDKPQLHAKFEVASFSHCTNIKGNPKILGSSPSPRPHPLFLWV